MTSSNPDQPAFPEPSGYTTRDAFRKRRSKRQTLVFGFAILGMVVALLLGFLGLTGSILLPFGSDFTKKVHLAEPGDTPCPRPGARPVDAEGARVRVFNTTSRTGLAGTVGTSLEELGYELAGTDNSAPYRGFVKIEAGPRGVDDAYTVARYFGNDTRIVLTDAEDRTLTITLGVSFESLPPMAELEEIAASRTALVPKTGCVPLGEPLGGWELQSGQSGQSGALPDGDSEENPEEDASENS